MVIFAAMLKWFVNDEVAIQVQVELLPDALMVDVNLIQTFFFLQ